MFKIYRVPKWFELGYLRTPLLLFRADLDQCRLVPKLLLGRLGQPALILRLCASPLGERTNLGPLARGPVFPPSAVLRPKRQCRRLVLSPRPRLLAPSRGSTARHSARPSEILLVESVWVDVGGILNPDHLSAKSAAASKRKVRSRPGNGHDNPFQCFNKHETLEKEGIEFEATCSQFSS